jgi:hypothetical protein
MSLGQQLGTVFALISTDLVRWGCNFTIRNTIHILHILTGIPKFFEKYIFTSKYINKNISKNVGMFVNDDVFLSFQSINIDDKKRLFCDKIKLNQLTLDIIGILSR